MSDFELINKTAHRIYPTHLKEVDNSSFSWSGVLPTDAKSRLVKDSEGHKQTDDRNSHTLTHKLKGGASIEFNIVQNGKNHIAMAKYHKGGKLFTAIHAHEDPSKAIKTAYDSVARRIVTEEAEIALIEKMEKRIEKKTGKLSDKKEKIDVEPSEEKELKESTPPGMESWVKKNKARFVKEYGEKKGHEVLYATAWKLHDKMNEMEELNELSKKTLASYIKQASHHARRNEYYAGRDHGKNQQESDKELEVSRKRQKGIEKAADKLAEAHTYTKEGLAKQIKYHENRAAHHDSEAQASFNKAQDLTGDKADLHFNAAKGHKAIADLHRKHIYDLKSFAGLTEAELNELSPSALGRYIKFAAIDKSKHAAHGAISDMAMYNAQNRGDKKDAQREKERGDVHRKKEDKRTSGILTATDKLVRKAHGLHEASRPAPHPDKVVMTSSIRKDLGGGYMAKTRNGHFYKLNINAFGEPGKGRELPKLGTVLDTSKHKFIGKDKVDLNLLKEDLDHDHPDMKAYHAACKARDEAHLASIRYRMNHDIKQPEHRAKYDELEAEHHRLRDIEDAASEKVNGKLFAHHALKEQLITEAEEDHFKKVPEGLEWEPYSLRGYGSTEHGYKSKDGHWKLVPYHTTTYKKVKNTRLRDPGKTRYDFSVAVHNDGKWLGTKRFAGVTGEHNRDKIEAGKQKMTTALTKKIPNFNEFHVSH